VPFRQEEQIYFEKVLREPSQFRSTDIDVDANGLIINQKMFNSYHPPLYYLLLGWVDRNFHDKSLIVRFQFLRCMSMMFGMISLVVVYFIGLQLFKRDELLALTLVAMVSLQPQVSYTFASLTNIAMEIPLSCLHAFTDLTGMNT